MKTAYIQINSNFNLLHLRIIVQIIGRKLMDSNDKGRRSMSMNMDLEALSSSEKFPLEQYKNEQTNGGSAERARVPAAAIIRSGTQLRDTASDGQDEEANQTQQLRRQCIKPRKIVLNSQAPLMVKSYGRRNHTKLKSQKQPAQRARRAHHMHLHVFGERYQSTRAERVPPVEELVNVNLETRTRPPNMDRPDYVVITTGKCSRNGLRPDHRLRPPTLKLPNGDIQRSPGAAEDAKVKMTFDLLLQQKYHSGQTDKTRSEYAHTFHRSGSRLKQGSAGETQADQSIPQSSGNHTRSPVLVMQQNLGTAVCPASSQPLSMSGEYQMVMSPQMPEHRWYNIGTGMGSVTAPSPRKSFHDTYQVVATAGSDEPYVLANFNLPPPPARTAFGKRQLSKSSKFSEFKHNKLNLFLQRHKYLEYKFGVNDQQGSQELNSDEATGDEGTSEGPVSLEFRVQEHGATSRGAGQKLAPIATRCTTLKHLSSHQGVNGKYSRFGERDTVHITGPTFLHDGKKTSQAQNQRDSELLRQETMPEDADAKSQMSRLEGWKTNQQVRLSTLLNTKDLMKVQQDLYVGGATAEDQLPESHRNLCANVGDEQAVRPATQGNAMKGVKHEPMLSQPLSQQAQTQSKLFDGSWNMAQTYTASGQFRPFHRGIKSGATLGPGRKVALPADPAKSMDFKHHMFSQQAELISFSQNQGSDDARSGSRQGSLEKQQCYSYIHDVKVQMEKTDYAYSQQKFNTKMRVLRSRAHANRRRQRRLDPAKPDRRKSFNVNPHLHLQGKQEKPLMSTDESKLRQVLGNALKSSPPKSDIPQFRTGKSSAFDASYNQTRPSAVVENPSTGGLSKINMHETIPDASKGPSPWQLDSRDPKDSPQRYFSGGARKAMQYIVIDKKDMLKAKPSLFDRKNDGTISFIHSTRLGQNGQDRLLSCSDAVDSKGDQVVTANRSESFKSMLDAQHQLLQTFSPSKIDLNRNIVSPDEVPGGKDGNYKDEPSFNGRNSKGLRIVIPQPAKNKHFQQYMQKRAAAFRRHSHFSVHTLAAEKGAISSHTASMIGIQVGKKTNLGARATAASFRRDTVAAQRMNQQQIMKNNQKKQNDLSMNQEAKFLDQMFNMVCTDQQYERLAKSKTAKAFEAMQISPGRAAPAQPQAQDQNQNQMQQQQQQQELYVTEPQGIPQRDLQIRQIQEALNKAASEQPERIIRTKSESRASTNRFQNTLCPSQKSRPNLKAKDSTSKAHASKDTQSRQSQHLLQSSIVWAQQTHEMDPKLSEPAQLSFEQTQTQPTRGRAPIAFLNPEPHARSVKRLNKDNVMIAYSCSKRNQQQVPTMRKKPYTGTLQGEKLRASDSFSAQSGDARDNGKHDTLMHIIQERGKPPSAGGHSDGLDKDGAIRSHGHSHLRESSSSCARQLPKAENGFKDFPDIDYHGTAELSLEAQYPPGQIQRIDEPKIIGSGDNSQHRASRDQVQKLEKSASSANMTQSGSFVKLAAMNIEATNVQSSEQMLNVARVDALMKDIDEAEKSKIVLEGTVEAGNTKLQGSARSSSPKTEHDLKTIEKIMMVNHFDRDLDQRIAMQQATSGRVHERSPDQKGYLDHTFMDKSWLDTRNGPVAGDRTLPMAPSLVIKDVEISKTAKGGPPAAQFSYSSAANAAVTPPVAKLGRNEERPGPSKTASFFGDMLAQQKPSDPLKAHEGGRKNVYVGYLQAQNLQQQSLAISNNQVKSPSTHYNSPAARQSNQIPIIKNTSRTQASLVPLGANAASTIAGSNPTLSGAPHPVGTAPAFTPQDADLAPSATPAPQTAMETKHNHSRSVINLQNVDLQEIFFMNKSIKKNAENTEEGEQIHCGEQRLLLSQPPMQVKVTSTKRGSMRDQQSRLEAIREDAQALLDQQPRRSSKPSYANSNHMDFQEIPRQDLTGPQFEYQKVEQSRQLSHLYYTQNVGVLMQPLGK